ncbi:hypothetical protein [Pseudomonas sp.]|uniref:hypothetical protein n=1 Tax=Pseudomonas sp. TaxID=306 RepID=UPI002604D48E|nr:hypothetical protein [Pseudomonas sp.]
MTTTAFEANRHLNIDLGSGEIFTIPPLPGRLGRDALAYTVSIAFGTSLQSAPRDADWLSKVCLGFPYGEPGDPDHVPGSADHADRFERFETYRASEQERIIQAAIVWNVQGGSLDAVHDLLNTAAGDAYPKALVRVMASCGLAEPYQALLTFLAGGSESPTQAESTGGTSTPIGTSNTSESATNPSNPG